MGILKKFIQAMAFAIVLTWLTAPAALAATELPLEINQAYYLPTSTSITKVSVGNPAIADVAVVSDNELLVIGKGSGSTTLIVWTDDGIMQEFTVAVGGSNRSVEKAIERSIGISGVQVEKIGDKILLRGKVTNQYEKNTAENIAKLYGADVEDWLQMTNPSQIRIEAQIIEMSDTDAEKIGLQYSAATAITADTDTGFRTVTLGSSGVYQAGEDFVGEHDTQNWIINHFSHINATVNALISTGKAKILSRPSISTMSGEKANILIGGEIPVPISDQNGNITVEWKKYGIQLNIEPNVDQDNNITSKVHASISNLDYSNAVKLQGGFTMPGLTSREAEAVVNVPSGMTMAIGGLLNSTDSKQIEKVPLLGNIPIIGEFFKNTVNNTDKREMIVLITPTLVNETTPARMTPNMDEYYKSSREEDKNNRAVELNPVPQDVKAGETAQQPADDSLLGKYLDHSVLTKPAAEAAK